MERKSIPAGLVPRDATKVMTAETMPERLRGRHQLKPGCWGALHILEGSVHFVEFPSGEECLLSAPDVFVIPPQSPHKLRLDGPVSCRVDFFYGADEPIPVSDESDESDEDESDEDELDESDESDEDELDESDESDPLDHRALRESFRRCEGTGDFAEVFYDIFLNASPEIGPYFAKTDFDAQKLLLRSTVYVLVTRDPNDVNARRTLERIGETHSRFQLAVRPALYEIWLDSLCQTVKKLDPDWREEIEEGWRLLLRPGIQIITARF